MSNSNNYNNIQSRSLWIGDIEYWMDEGFIIKIFEGVGNFFIYKIKYINDNKKFC